MAQISSSNTYATTPEDAVKRRMTITEVAEIVGINPKTIVRWEKAGKVRKAKRNWRGWRIYEEGDLDSIKTIHDTLTEF